MCRYVTKLGYQYDDLVPSGDALNPDGTINQPRYEAGIRSLLEKFYPSTHQIVKQFPGYVSKNNDFNDYVINVIYDRYALNGRAYAILFFLGSPPENLNNYHESPNFAGLVYTFTTPIYDETGSLKCSNCEEQKSKKILSKAQVPLTLRLIAKIAGDSSVADPGWIPAGSAVDGLPPDTVGVILENQLNWTFVEIGGRERPSTDFPDTEIGVHYGKGTLPSHRDDQLIEAPAYGGYKKLPRATRAHHLGSGHPGTLLNMIRDDP
jgi:tyrosinase